MPGDINLKTTEILALFRAPPGVTGAYIDRVEVVGTDKAGGRIGLWRGLRFDGQGIYGFALEPAATFPVDVAAIWMRPAAEGETEPTTLSYRSRESIDVTITGVEVGTWYDRDPLNHYHPRIETLLINQSALKETTDTLGGKVGTLERDMLDVKLALASLRGG